MIDINDDSLISFQEKGSLVADFTDEMELLTSGIGRDTDIDHVALSIVDS